MPAGTSSTRRRCKDIPLTTSFVKLSRHFKQLVDGSIELQLRIDLAIDGYLLGYRGTDPAKDLREFHEKRRKALESMKYTQEWKEPIDVGDFGNFEAGGIFLAISFPPNLIRPRFAMASLPKSSRTTQLVLFSRNLSTKNWFIPDREQRDGNEHGTT
jgi:hypothetical protein